MKTRFIISLTILSLIVLTTTTFAQEADGDIWKETQNHPRVSSERVDRILDRIGERNPEEADRLRGLKENNPEAFRDELRKISKRYMQSRQARAGGQEDGRPMHFGSPPQRRRGEFRKRMQEGKEQFEEWLEENYPQKAVELSNLEEDNPRLYRQELMESIREYGQLYRAEKNNPELAEVLREDMRLKDSVNQIVDQIKDTDNAEEKQELRTELNNVLEERFDLIIKRKELQIAEMKEKLAELQKRVAEKEVDIQELKVKKDSEVDSRMEELLSEEVELNWN